MTHKDNLATYLLVCAIKENEGYVAESRSLALKSLCTCQTRFSQFTLGFLGLALCVFMWGLQYKLSLYDPPGSASHKMPTAKLLSKNEWGAGIEVAPVAKSSVFETEMRLALICLALPMLASMIRLQRLVWVRRTSDIGCPWRQQLDATLSAFSFRPPPIPA
jgi:hypothetical protein